MARTRISNNDLSAQALDGALEAFHTAGIVIQARHTASVPLRDTDFEIDLRVDDRDFTLLIQVKSNCTGQIAKDLVGQDAPIRPAVPFLVADRITGEGRTILTEAGWSWLDRRGHLYLRAPGVRIDVDVPAIHRTSPSSLAPPIRGGSGLTIAYWLCANPGQSLSPRGSTKLLRLAPSTISTTVRELADAGLVDESGAAIAPELFWELAATWRTERTWLLRTPDPIAHLSADSGAPSWKIAGDLAAATYGAPVVAAGEGSIELYVNGPVEVSIAARRYGVAEPGTGAAVIAVPPTSLVNEGVGEVLGDTIYGWPVAPMVAVALDLAQDRSRGREILEDWKAGDGIWL